MKFKSLAILGIIALGASLRFYKLDWGQGLFTHPDEYHIVSSVTQLSFPNQMHPHFFSYGTVTIYLIYFTKEFINFFSAISNFFIIGRFYSALFSTLTIFIVYKFCVNFFTKKRFALIASFLIAITPGLIQQAHFATPESAQIFFLFSSLFFMIRFIKQNKITNLALVSIFFGLSLGVKISSIVFLLPLITAVIIKSYSKTLSFKTLILFIKYILITTSISAITFAIVAPFVFLDFAAFRSNLEYEGGLAMGKFSVFYTRQFINTTPALFQIEKILPYALGPSLLLFSVLGFILALINIIRRPKIELLILIAAFLSLYIPNAFLFAKWTRFIAPTFPFFAIFAVFLLQELPKKMKFLFYSLGILLLAGTFFWTMAFSSIYTNHDIRTTASNWIMSHAKDGSNFLVEGGNTVDLPLGGNFQRTSLDFYSLENDLLTREKIVDAMQSSDYFIIQSRRVFYNHQKLSILFPRTKTFYDALFDGKLGFRKIQEFHSYPKLQIGNWKLEIPDETAEETWSVFDHPVIRVFEKTQHLTKKEYAEFLEN